MSEQRNCEVSITGVLTEIRVETIKSFTKTCVRGLINKDTKWEKIFEVELSKKLIDNMPKIEAGDEIKLTGFVNFREWNDKVFSSVIASSIEVLNKAKPQDEKEKLPFTDVESMKIEDFSCDSADPF